VITAKTQLPVALLGGGQLARMLALAAAPLGVETLPLTDSAEDPAAQVCREAVHGSVNDRQALRRVLSRCRIALFENEFVDTALIREAAQGLEVRFAPSLEVIHRLQDKLRQKELLRELGIAAVAHLAMPVDVQADEVAALRWVSGLANRWPHGFVLKWAQLGYDGYGTWISSRDRQDAEASLREFLAKARSRGVSVFAEEKIDFARELAIVACRSTTGELATYPLVISEQEQGV
jgi:5-(carboxyamino)imidazole ribonucleotide synthase